MAWADVRGRFRSWMVGACLGYAVAVYMASEFSQTLRDFVHICGIGPRAVPTGFFGTGPSSAKQHAEAGRVERGCLRAGLLRSAAFFVCLAGSRRSVRRRSAGLDALAFAVPCHEVCNERRSRSSVPRRFFGGETPLTSPSTPPAEERAVLDAIEAGQPEADVLALAAALESKRVGVGGLEPLLGTWELAYISSSKFDVRAPLGKRVDGTAPGLEGLFEAISDEGAKDSTPATSSEAAARASASSSPVQRLVTRLFPSFQVIDDERVDTVVNLAGIGTLRLSAKAEPLETGGRLNFTFDGGFFQFGPVRVPYPVPFQLLGDEAKGWIETTYCSERLRVSRGNKGTVFILKKQRPLDVLILPGLGNDSGDYAALRGRLERDGLSVGVVPVARLDWLRNAVGILDSNWWAGTLKPRPVLDWYLDRVSALLDEASAGGRKIVLLGHSAGGWLARITLGETAGRGVSRLVTLGTPHCPPLPGSSGSFDQTRGLLTYVQTEFPTLPVGVEGVAVAGRFLEGTESPLPDAGAFLVGLGYKQVHGRGDVWGDGIVPEPSAFLPGMEAVRLEGVYHSPLGAGQDRKWYGDEEVVSQWKQYLR